MQVGTPTINTKNSSLMSNVPIKDLQLVTSRRESRFFTSRFHDFCHVSRHALSRRDVKRDKVGVTACHGVKNFVTA